MKCLDGHHSHTNFLDTIVHSNTRNLATPIPFLDMLLQLAAKLERVLRVVLSEEGLEVLHDDEGVVVGLQEPVGLLSATFHTVLVR